MTTRIKATYRADEWRDEAICIGINPELFFDKHASHQLKSVCFRCPVRESCLEEALSSYEQYGLWGGLSAVQRENIKKERRRLAKEKQCLNQN